MLAATSAVALAPAAESAVAPQTTAPPPVVTVKVTMTDASFRMSPKIAQRGTIARFILVNTGKKAHTFTLGHERRGTATQTGFTKTLKPHQQHVSILYLDYRGAIPYAGTMPADRLKTAMKGTFRII